jgi:protein NirF
MTMKPAINPIPTPALPLKGREKCADTLKFALMPLKGRETSVRPVPPPSRGRLGGGWGRDFILACLLTLSTAINAAPSQAELMATGDLGLIVERATGSLLEVNTTKHTILRRIEGLGDLSHASLVFSRDERYAFVFGRDGGLSKIDMLTGAIVKRVIQSGNAIGGAISQDGRIIAAANYTPGGVKFFDTDSLELLAEIPTGSKVVGIEDSTDNRFAFSLWENAQGEGEIWVADLSNDPKNPKITRYPNIGKQPYDALISPDGRWYVAGLFGEKGIAVLDMWHPERGVKRALPDYGRSDPTLPVYKMPHLETWAMVGNLAFIPGVGRHEVVIVDVSTWQQVGVIPVAGQPVFVIARPDGRQLWVNFAFPDYAKVQVIDVEARQVINTLQPGKAVLHMEFSPRGEQVWLSVRDGNRVEVYDTRTQKKRAELPALAPSGIFFTPRAHRFGL